MPQYLFKGVISLQYAIFVQKCYFASIFVQRCLIASIFVPRCYVAADVDMDGKVDGSEFSGMIEVRWQSTVL